MHLEINGIKNRIYKWVETRQILPNSQFGFRNHRSSIDNIAILTSHIYHSWYKDKVTSALFLDIQGAYDNVLGDILIKRLINLDMPRPYIQFIFNLISYREVHFRFNDINCVKIVNNPDLTQTTQSLGKGLPQGCVLNPLLYAIYVAELETLVQNQPNMYILQFADDICLYSSTKTSQEGICNLERTVNLLSH